MSQNANRVDETYLKVAWYVDVSLRASAAACQPGSSVVGCRNRAEQDNEVNLRVPRSEAVRAARG
jgi:hypothetical protein